jgi:pimeloyl-ACP methyl ester carboxylesterase
VARILTALVAVAALCTAAPNAVAQSDTSGYCEPENVQYDPRDTERDTPPTPLPTGFTRRDFTVDGLHSPLIEAGSPKSREAIVFMHGNSGSSLDFAGILRAAPPGARVLAFDLYGFGEADKPWDFSYSLADSMPLLTHAATKLGLDRIHLVGHDIGGVLGIEWASLHPAALASATLLSSGVLIGYEDHDYARIWRRPGEGEAFMAARRAGSSIRASTARSPNRSPTSSSTATTTTTTVRRAARCSRPHGPSRTCPGWPSARRGA